MGRGLNIPWIGGGSIYHGFEGQNTMGRVRYTMDRGFDIPWVGGSIYHGEGR